MLHLPALLRDSTRPAFAYTHAGDDPRVLIVEPRQALRRQMGLALRRAGLEVDFAAHAGEAEARAGTARYAAAVLDVDLSHPQGLALCRRLARGAAVPVVAVCASATLVGRLRARLAGARACLVRPMELEDFVRTVRGLAERTTTPIQALPRSV